jgi:hypothetical protein
LQSTRAPSSQPVGVRCCAAIQTESPRYVILDDVWQYVPSSDSLTAGTWVPLTLAPSSSSRHTPFMASAAFVNSNNGVRNTDHVLAVGAHVDPRTGAYLQLDEVWRLSLDDAAGAVPDPAATVGSWTSLSDNARAGRRIAAHSVASWRSAVVFFGGVTFTDDDLGICYFNDVSVLKASRLLVMLPCLALDGAALWLSCCRR